MSPKQRRPNQPGPNQRRPGKTGGGNRRAAAPRGRNWPWWVVGGAVVVAGVFAVVLSYGGRGTSPKSTSSTGGTKPGLVEIASTVAVSGTPLPMLTSSTKDPAVGKTAPTLTGVTSNGLPVTIGNAGKAHLVVMVAHWCPHCQAEVPRIVALSKAGQIPVPVVSVATGTDPSAPNYPPSAWLAREGWPYPVLMDTKTGTAANSYGLPGYPFLVFVDAQGKVAGRLSGEVASSDLTKLFAALAAEKSLPIPGAGASSAGK